jgi:NADPH:quinone reductase-like Zn-dependent oxidoreductase
LKSVSITTNRSIFIMVLSTMKAMVTEVPENGSKPELIKKDISPPMLEPHEVLVKVTTVAQNPTDVQAFDLNLFGNGAVLGCDFAGKVERLGKDVTKVTEGDIIAGLIWGGEVKGLGAYSEYTKAHESICFKVPKSISLAEAATIPLASLTAWLAFFSKDSLNIDRNKSDTTVLIWGGSSSVGQYAIQIATILGFNIITTCSPHSFDLVKSFGATHVFDYSDPDVVKSIKDVAPSLKYVFDTIGKETSSAKASEAIDENGGTLCTVRPDKSFTENVTKQTKVTPVLVWTAFNRVIQYKKASFPASEDDHKLGAEFNEKLPGWINEGKIKPNKPKVLGGLDAIPQGFQEHRDGKISGFKIVYEL